MDWSQYRSVLLWYNVWSKRYQGLWSEAPSPPASPAQLDPLSLNSCSGPAWSGSLTLIWHLFCSSTTSHCVSFYPKQSQDPQISSQIPAPFPRPRDIPLTLPFWHPSFFPLPPWRRMQQMNHTPSVIWPHDSTLVPSHTCVSSFNFNQTRVPLFQLILISNPSFEKAFIHSAVIDLFM